MFNVKLVKMRNFRIVIVLVFSLIITSCNEYERDSTSSSGIKKATVKIETGSDGLSVEQRNIVKRLKEDNTLGSIKHLYIISAMSGQVIMYSTVDGKVTSGGKRLTPKTTSGEDGYTGSSMRFSVGNNTYRTTEVIQDDGTYGDSMNYLYWWDVKGVYHQHYITGGQIAHISSEAMPVTEIIINLSE